MTAKTPDNFEIRKIIADILSGAVKSLDIRVGPDDSLGLKTGGSKKADKEQSEFLTALIELTLSKMGLEALEKLQKVFEDFPTPITDDQYFNDIGVIAQAYANAAIPDPTNNAAFRDIIKIVWGCGVLHGIGLGKKGTP